MNPTGESALPLANGLAPSDSPGGQGIQLTPFQQHYQAAIDHLARNEPEKAAKRFLHAAIADPEEWTRSADLIAKGGHPDVAIAALRESIRLHDGRKDVLAASWCSIGNILYDQGKNDEALETFIISWGHWKTGGAAANIALMFLRKGELAIADTWIKIALAIDPWSAEAQMVQADITFNKGDYLTGFKQYECRWRSRRHGLKKLASNHPEWTGKEKGHLLVFGEQGMGDVILALRYARLIKDLGLTQTWVIQPTMKSLAQSMGIIDNVLGPGEDIPHNDFHISSCSLPRVLGTTMETTASDPYIAGRGFRPMADKVGDKLRVGICWRGNSANPNNPFRSTRLSEHWEPVLSVGDVMFYSFQFGDGEDEASKADRLIYKIAVPKDWRETRDAVSNMDLVISVDTAMVHLAGAMGIPCWVPLHCRHYWAYPLCCGDRTPWYPSVRLFRQKKEFEWEPVFEEIASELKGL